MTTITATIPNKKDVKIVKEIFERFGIEYTVEGSAEDYKFSEAQIAEFERTQKEFVAGQSSAQNWEDIKKNLESVYA